MAKGDTFYNRFHEYKDAYTGKLVVKLTSHEYLSHHPYFYNKMLTNDDRFLIYACNRDGDRNLYKMDLFDGNTLQVTEGSGNGDFGCNLTWDDKYLVFCRGNRILKLCMQSLEEEIIYENPQEWHGYGNPGLSSDSRYLVTVEIKESDKLPTTGDWSNFEPQWRMKPQCRIVYVDIEKKDAKVIHQENCWLGHPQIRPGDNNTIMFCHEGPWNLVDARIWLIDAEGSKLQCARPRQCKERIGHEYWLVDGSKLAYVYYPEDEFNHEGTIRLMDPFTLKEEILMTCPGYCHIISNIDNTKIAGDGRNKEDSFIYLLDVKAKKAEKLCFHGSNWRFYGSTQDAHVHPAFSHDGSFIIYTSDQDGMPCVYKVML